MDLPTLYAIGAFIQALGQNPGLEAGADRACGTAAHVYVGTGIGNVDTIARRLAPPRPRAAPLGPLLGGPERNPPLREYLAALAAGGEPDPEVPPPPDAVPRRRARWRPRTPGGTTGRRARPTSPPTSRSCAEIESLDRRGARSRRGKLRVMKEKQRRLRRSSSGSGARPTPPWRQVSANVLWNIHNTPAAQISMLGRITGLAFAPVGACSTFGVTLKLAMDAIRRGEAKAVVHRRHRPPPHPLVVGAFYSARVISADATVSKPLTGLRGTHVAGGAAIWIVGDLEHMTARGFKPLGHGAAGGRRQLGRRPHHHPLDARGRSPPSSRRSPAPASRPEEIVSWDLHATATPGDYLEVDNLRGVRLRLGPGHRPQGHLRPRHGRRRRLGADRPVPRLRARRALPHAARAAASSTARSPASTTASSSTSACPAPQGPAGKLSMGVGGINACVISRPW